MIYFFLVVKKNKMDQNNEDIINIFFEFYNILPLIDFEINLESIGEVLLYNEMEEEFKKKINNCAICSEPYTENSKIFITKCFHNFCYNCIDTWINKEIKNSCPMCRNSLEDF